MMIDGVGLFGQWNEIGSEISFVFVYVVLAFLLILSWIIILVWIATFLAFMGKVGIFFFFSPFGHF